MSCLALFVRPCLSQIIPWPNQDHTTGGQAVSLICEETHSGAARWETSQRKARAEECPKAGEVRIKKRFHCVQAWAVGPALMEEVRAIVVRVELSM